MAISEEGDEGFLTEAERKKIRESAGLDVDLIEEIAEEKIPEEKPKIKTLDDAIKAIESLSEGQVLKDERIEELEYEAEVYKDELLKLENSRKQMFTNSRRYGGEESGIPPTGGQTVASSLAPQLGSDGKVLATGGVDMRRLSIIDKKKMMAIIYFIMRGDKVKFWKRFTDNYLNLAPSVGGLGRRQLIQMQKASSPGGEEAPMEEPGFIGKHITNRNWKEEQNE